MPRYRPYLCSAGMLVTMALMGMDGGCTQSQRPLGDRADGFADHYLAGEWHELSVGDDGTFASDALLYRVAYDAAGNLQVTSYDEDDGSEQGIYSAYTTRLGADKYLNVRPVDCPGCDDDERAAMAADDCPYTILRYETYLPERVLRKAADESTVLRDAVLANSNRLRGRLLFVEAMDDDVVRDMIDAGSLEGTADCPDCSGEGACIRATQAGLRAFVGDSGDEVYKDLLMLIRE